MKKIYPFALVAVAALLAVGGSTALAGKHRPNPCASGTLAPGTYNGFTVTGVCNVAFNASVTINGDLRLADGAVFGGIIPSTVHVTGDVNVGEGALLGLGYATQTDVVDGSIKADQPLSLYLGFVTVHGDVTSNGGGTADRFYNFPIKDNTIDGNLTSHGWQGGWIGAIRNTVGGNVDVSNNMSVVHATDRMPCDGLGHVPEWVRRLPGGDRTRPR